MNRDHDTEAFLVATCPEGAPHPLRVPRNMKAHERLLCSCGRSYSFSEAQWLVKDRDAIKKEPPRRT